MLRTAWFKMRAAAARPTTAMCKGRGGRPGTHAPCGPAIYSESRGYQAQRRRMA